MCTALAIAKDLHAVRICCLCAIQARQEAHESLAKAREEAEAAVQAAELQTLKAQEEAQNAHAAAQSAASSVEQWKPRCAPRSCRHTPCAQAAACSIKY